MGRVYRAVPVLAEVPAAATNERLMIFEAADDQPYYIRSIVVSQKGNNANETYDVTVNTITTPAGGDTFTTTEPVDENDAAFSGTISRDNGTALTGTIGNPVFGQAGHVQAPTQLVPTEPNGYIARVSQTNPIVLVVNVPGTAITPVVTATLEEI